MQNSLIFLTSRIDPQHAIEAGYKVEYTAVTEVCDFCNKPKTRSITVNPMPNVISGRNILYFNGEWAFCNRCFKLYCKKDWVGLIQITVDANPFANHVDPEVAFNAANHLVSSIEYATKPYRPKEEALDQLKMNDPNMVVYSSDTPGVMYPFTDRPFKVE